MRRILFILAMFLAFLTAAGATPQLSSQTGRWVCLPDSEVAPQVLVDFEEKAYRRCDQNTCVSYDILAVRRHGDLTEIAFAPDAVMRAADDGARYSEVLQRGETTLITSGACTFRDEATAIDTIEED